MNTRRISVSSLFLVMSLALSVQAYGGAFTFADEQNGLDIVTHPGGYNGNQNTLTVRVCINPSSPNATLMENPVQNNIAVFNQLVPTTANLKQGANNNVPANHIDFESVSLHEIGHCLGLAHPNAATESLLTGNDQNYTRATNGANNSFDLNPGNDGVIGSSDDIRGDDRNLVWFRTSNNDPFTMDSIVDSTTYSRDLADLPPGQTFAANADRAVSTLLGYPQTEAVMQQGTFVDEAQRTLGHDDIATLRYAASGINERATSGWTQDDYNLVLEYGGISNANCDISMSITSTPNLAFCAVSGIGIGGNHVQITSATIEFGQDFNWFFNSNNSAPVLDAIGDQTLVEGETLVVPITATDPEGNNLAYAASMLPTFANLIDNGNDTATLTIAPEIGDASTSPVSISVMDNGVPELSDEETFSIQVTALDTDGDTISDYDERTVWGTLPDNPDTDGDQISDGDEINVSDPLDPLSWPHFADGDIAPLGAPDGLVNAQDYLLAQRIVAGELTASSLELAHGDLFPTGAPDGVINISDLMLLLELLD